MKFDISCRVLALSALAGCTGPDAAQITAQCTAEAMRDLPPRIESRVETRYRQEQHPTGQVTCYADNSGAHLVDSLSGTAYRDPSGAICIRQVQDVQVPYRVRVESDQNDAARQAQVSACLRAQSGSTLRQS